MLLYQGFERKETYTQITALYVVFMLRAHKYVIVVFWFHISTMNEKWTEFSFKTNYLEHRLIELHRKHYGNMLLMSRSLLSKCVDRKM